MNDKLRILNHDKIIVYWILAIVHGFVNDWIFATGIDGLRRMDREWCHLCGLKRVFQRLSSFGNGVVFAGPCPDNSER